MFFIIVQQGVSVIFLHVVIVQVWLVAGENGLHTDYLSIISVTYATILFIEAAPG